MMRPKTSFVLLISAVFVLAGVFLIFGGILSTPRDFSSPQTIIRLVNENGAPLSGIEVGRAWHDSDCKADGHETMLTDKTGVCVFAKVPATVGLFTGALRKMCGVVMACGPGGGTYTTIYVRYHGRCKVVPKGKSLHPVGQSNQDPDGVWFLTSTDSLSNTMVNLTFPEKAKKYRLCAVFRASRPVTRIVVTVMELEPIGVDLNSQ
jgi:hypothetical protein